MGLLLVLRFCFFLQQQIFFNKIPKFGPPNSQCLLWMLSNARPPFNCKHYWQAKSLSSFYEVRSVGVRHTHIANHHLAVRIERLAVMWFNLLHSMVLGSHTFLPRFCEEEGVDFTISLLFLHHFSVKSSVDWDYIQFIVEGPTNIIVVLNLIYCIHIRYVV